MKSLAVPCIDLLSEEAHVSGVRKGIWGEKFTDFLPVILDPKHASRSLKAAPAYFAKILNVPASTPLASK